MTSELTFKCLDDIEMEDFITLLLEGTIRKYVKLTWRGELFDTKTFHVELLNPEDYLDDDDT